jgi:hypothetical protein
VAYHIVIDSVAHAGIFGLQAARVFTRTEVFEPAIEDLDIFLRSEGFDLFQLYDLVRGPLGRMTDR